jgi:hypothetical protein
MNVRWLKPGDVLAGAGGVLLLVSLFLPWYRQTRGPVERTNVTGWEAFAVFDLLLALAALVGVALAVAIAVRRTPTLPVALAVIGTPVGALATVLVVIRVLEPPGDDRLLQLASAPWLGLVGALAVAAGAWWSLCDERNRGVPPAQVEVRPTPPAGPEAA